MADQWIRKASLTFSSGAQVLDLSEMHFTFVSQNADEMAPNTIFIRVYNLKDETAKKIVAAKPTAVPGSGPEFTEVIVQAGYETGNYGIIFKGTVKQVAVGRENSTDRYLDIWAADGDLWHNFAVVNMALRAGMTNAQVLAAIAKGKSSNGVAPLPFAKDVDGIVGADIGTTLTQRGKVLYGMARDYVRDWEKTYGYRCSIQNGELVATKITGYRPGEAVVLSSTTGLIGIPEAVNGGLNCTVLLNPLIQVGCLVRIDKSDINQITQQQTGLTYGNPVASVVTQAGYYRVLVCEVEGDTRGAPWYSKLVCLAVDITAKDQNNAVKANG